jgi:hypothetical protein
MCKKLKNNKYSIFSFFQNKSNIEALLGRRFPFIAGSASIFCALNKKKRVRMFALNYQITGKNEELTCFQPNSS